MPIRPGSQTIPFPTFRMVCDQSESPQKIPSVTTFDGKENMNTKSFCSGVCHNVKRMGCCSLPALWLILCLPAVTSAQMGTTFRFLKNNVRLTGQANIYGELYDVSGTDRRRPPSTSRIVFTPTLTFSKLFSISGDFILSTEGSSARQNMNIMGLHPVWSWGKAHLGDFTDDFSRYTFHGVNVKGGEIDLYPGRYRLTLGGGQTRRAVDGNLINESYDQHLFAARAGYGNPHSTFVDLVFVKVKDDPASNPKPDYDEYDYVLPDTLETELDTLWIEPPYNPYAVTPQENVVAGLVSRISILGGRVALLLEGSGSAYTKDLNSEKVDIDSIETGGFIRDALGRIFTPRRSSNFDFAANTQFQLNLKNVNAQAGFRHVGPGYVSLGMPSTVNDRREYFMKTTWRLNQNRFSVHWNRLSDNLLDQKEETNLRSQYRAAWMMNTRRWRSNMDISILTMGNDAVSDSAEWNFSNLIFSTHQSLVFDRELWIRQLGIKYTYQHSDKNIPDQGTESHYHTVNMTGSFRFGRSLILQATAGASHRKTSGKASYLTQIYSARLTHTAFQNRLSTSLQTNSSMVRDTRVFRTGITSGYRLTRHNQLVFNASYNTYSGTRDFQEFRTSLMLTHRL